jgi:hypothetical protein
MEGVQLFTSGVGGNGPSGPTGPAGPSGPSGPTGPVSTVPGPSGPTGPQGPVGTFGGNGFSFTFSTDTTDSDPGNGFIKFNNATYGDVSEIYVDLEEAGGTDITAWLNALADANNDPAAVLKIFSQAEPTRWATFTLTSVTSAVGYRKLAVVPVASSSAFTLTVGDTNLIFAPAGNRGDTGPPGTGPEGDPGDVVFLEASQIGTVDSGVFVYDSTDKRLTVRKIVGGTGTTQTLILQPTTGVGATGADIIFKVGNDGATEALRLKNDGSALFSGAVALGANNLTMTGSIASTGNRVTKGWFIDLEVTNAIVGSITGNAATASAATTLVTTHTIGGSNFNGSQDVTSFPAPGAIGGGTPAAGTFTALTGTSGALTGLTTLAIRDTSAAFDVTLAATSSTILTAGRALTFDLADAARTIKLIGNPTLANWFDQNVKAGASPTFVTVSATNFVSGYTTAATAAGTTTLTSASTQIQRFTGTAVETVVLPVTSTLSLGFIFRIINDSIANVTVQSSGGNEIVILQAGHEATFTCILTSGTTEASWLLGKLPINLVANNPFTMTVNDTVTNGSSTLLRYTHKSSSTPAAGFGLQAIWELEDSDTGSERQAFSTDVSWVDPAVATRKSRVIFRACDSGAPREGLRIEASGSAAMIGFLGASAALRQTGDAGTALVTLGLMSGTPTFATANLSGLGTGVATALAVNVGSAGAFITFNGALGTPSGGTVTNLTGTASININGTVGATTPAAGTFTSLHATGSVIIDGDLLVSGDAFEVDTASMVVEDPLIKLATANGADAVDIGFYGLYTSSGAKYTGLFRDATDGKWKLFSSLQSEPTTTVNTAGTGYAVATLVANVEGDVTGNATTATTLATSRNLWGQAFTGAADVTGSLTSVADITGGASSMLITAGTGNSRTLTIKTTSSGGVALHALMLDATQGTTVYGDLFFDTSGKKIFFSDTSLGRSAAGKMAISSFAIPLSANAQNITFAGLTAARTYTLPDIDGTLLYSGGPLGTPSSGTITNLSGTASININGTVGATTPAAGTFTALTGTSGALTGLTTLAIRDTSAAFDVTLAATSSTTITAGRTLTFDVANAARTLKLTGNPTLADWFDQSVKAAASPTFVTVTAALVGNATTATSAASLSVSGQTGLLSVTGLASTNRIKTVRDATDTILELGGSYTPSGTWTNLTLASPAMSGSPTAPTPTAGDNTTLVATTAFVTAAVNTAILGLDTKTPCRVASTANLNGTYLAGVLTNAGTLAALSIDGVSVATNDRVLLKDQTTGANNGLYVVTTVGSGAVAWVLTRSSDADATGELVEGNYTIIEEGTANAGTLWILTTSGTITIGTTSQTWTQLNITSVALANITGLGTGVATALAVNVGSAGAFVTLNGAGGTPSSITLTNATGTASININGTVGATTPAAGTFTTLVAGSTTSLLLGTAGSAVGNIGFRNATSGTATLAPPTGALGTYTVTLPNAASTLPIFGQQVTFTGPTAARSYALADSSVTLADTSTAQTFTTKTIIATTNVVEEITSTSSSATPTPTGGSLRNFFSGHCPSRYRGVAAPSGSPADGNIFTIRIKASGTQTLSWDSATAQLA